MRPGSGRIFLCAAGKSKEKPLISKKQAVFDGGDGEDRTLDLHTASVALSQLSYAPIIAREALSTQQIIAQDGSAVKQFYSEIPNNFLPFSVVMRSTSATSMPLMSAMVSAMRWTYSELLRRPRNGSGAI